MKKQILFIQGGGEGAYEEDGQLVAHLRNVLGDAYDVHYPQMPNESDPNYELWEGQIKKELAAREGQVVAAPARPRRGCAGTEEGRLR